MTTTRPATIELETRSVREVVDITERVDARLGGAPDGSCHLFLRHTTAGLMHDSAAHVAAHFLSGLVGPSVHVPVQGGRLALGEFQRIVLRQGEAQPKASRAYTRKA